MTKEKIYNLLADYGKNLGFAFQIADDCFRLTSESGIYIRSASGAREAILIRSTPELSDFYYANGSFNESKENSEFLSYFSNRKIRSDCKRWVFIPKSLPQTSLV